MARGEDCEQGILLETYTQNSSQHNPTYNKQLFDAVYNGTQDKVSDLLKVEQNLQNLQAQDKTGYTLWHFLAFSDNVNKVEPKTDVAIAILLTNAEKELLQVDPESEFVPQALSLIDSLGNTPLHHASQYKRFSLLFHILPRFKVDLSLKNGNGMTPFDLMADGTSRKAVDIVKKMCEKVEPEKLNDCVSNLIFIAARYISEENGMILYLINSLGLRPEARNSAGRTPLHEAAVAGTVDNIKILLSKCEDPDNYINIRTTKEGYTALHLAAKTLNFEVMAHLFSYKNCQMKIKSKNQETALHFVASQRYTKDKTEECINLLLEHPSIAMPGEKELFFLEEDEQRRTALETTCILGDEQTLEYLLTFRFGPLRTVPWLKKRILATLFATHSRTLLLYWDECVSNTDDDKSCSVDFSYIIGEELERNGDSESPLLVPDSGDTTCLSGILGGSQETRNPILKHPLIVIYLLQKWTSFRLIAYIWLVLQVVLVTVYTRLLILIYPSVETTTLTLNETIVGSQEVKLIMDLDSKKNSTDDLALPQCTTEGIIHLAILGLISLLTFIKEMIQLNKDPRTYLTSFVNWVQLFFLLIVFISIIPIFGHGNYSSWQNCFASLGGLLAWILLIRDFGKLPQCGRYSEVLVTVGRNSLKMILFFSPCLIGFAIGFRLLIKNKPEFNFPFYGIVKMFAMLIGEFEYNDLVAPESPKVVEAGLQVLFLTFTFLASIVILNLLVALAVDDIKKLLKDAETSSLVRQLRFIVLIEDVCLKIFKITNLRSFLLLAKMQNPVAIITFNSLSPELKHGLQILLPSYKGAQTKARKNPTETENPE